jgi:hypothetical protein
VIVVLWMACAWDSYFRLSLSKLLNYGVHIKFYEGKFRLLWLDSYLVRNLELLRL